jgi:hypothetical protein
MTASSMLVTPCHAPYIIILVMDTFVSKGTIKLLAFLIAVVISLSSCGGGGGTPTNPFKGIYKGNFTGVNPTTVVVSIGASGTTEAVVSDSTGVLVEGTGTTNDNGDVSVSMTGTAGATSLTGAFGRGRAQTGLNINMSGGINASGVNAPSTGNVSVYKGKYKFQFTGSSSGDLLVTISNDGTVYKRVGSTLTQVGKVTATGTITFGGTDLVTPSTTNTNWSGYLFLTPDSSGGSGTYVGKTDATFAGTWNAIPETPTTPVFNQVTPVKSLSPSDGISVLAASPNGHMVGFSGSKAVYWDTPDATPVELTNPGSTEITYMTSVNSLGAKVGYSYKIGQDPDSAVPTYWAPGSTSPSVLQLPDHYVAASPSGINDSGVIVGVVVHETNHVLRPCVWPAGGGQPFIPPQGDMGGIANNGVVVCIANKGYLPDTNAQNMIPIPPTVPYLPITLNGISAAGVILGHAPKSDDGFEHPLVWPDLTQAGIPLKFLDGYSEMIVYGAGQSGEYIGTGRVAASNVSQAFYWPNSTSVTLMDDIVKDNVIAFQGGQFVFANGNVIAYGKYPNGAFTVAYLQK